MCHTITAMWAKLAFIAYKPVIALFFFIEKAFIADTAFFTENRVVIKYFFTFFALGAVLNSLFCRAVKTHHAFIAIVVADAVFAPITNSTSCIEGLIVCQIAPSAFGAMLLALNRAVYASFAEVAPFFIFFFYAVFAFAAVGADRIIIIARTAVLAVIPVICSAVHALLTVVTPFIVAVLAAIAVHARLQGIFFEARSAFNAMDIFTAV